MPGPREPLIFKGKKSKKSWFFMNPAGETGASFSLYSHNGIMKFGVTTDVARVADP